MVCRTLLTLIVAYLATGCASSSGFHSSSDAEQAGSSGDVITMAELRQLDPALTLLDAIKRTRPSFLHPRGAVPTVSIDGSSGMELSVLETIRVVDVQEVRLVRGAGRSGPAVIRSDGAVVVGDVILIVTGPRRP